MADLFDESPSEPTTLFGAMSSLRQKKNEPKKEENVLPPIPQDNIPKENSPPPTPEPQPTPETPPSNNQEVSPKASKPKTKSSPKIKKVVIQKNTQKPKDNVRRSIAHLQQNLNRRFDELFQIINKLTPTEMPQGAVLTNDNIMRQIQSAVDDSKKKDQILIQKQEQIDQMTDTLSEHEERTQLRKRISSISEDIAAEAARFTDAQAELDFLSQQIERAKSELALLTTRTTQNETRMKSQYEKEISKFKSDVEQLKNDSEKAITTSKETSNLMNKKIVELRKENDRLKKSEPKVTEEEIDDFQDQIKEKLKEIVGAIAKGTYALIEKKIDSEEKYSGTFVQDTMKEALQEEASNVIDS
ncbi:peptidoglycan DD-metalloendopeptidase family protein [Histomonas meleagridis]|uniref:peptidoglycan DD-metalloendopeptidase family protein n=1 Tax=Histomonas meleagridis TaxID=135588 RepID=UPI003559E5D5|nr:peptidoglycan DD-metalloendopeptidase family protein [Histomonas meleagridis]KAH0801902.1 peptidoglycan DD-metalloendopeptidase family protein [Histomonas meleagridis]